MRLIDCWVWHKTSHQKHSIQMNGQGNVLSQNGRDALNVQGHLGTAKTNTSNNTCHCTGTHACLMNVKKNIFFGKRSTIFFSILKVDETKSSRGGATSNRYGQSYGNNASNLKITSGTLMHCTVQLHKNGQQLRVKEFRDFSCLNFCTFVVFF